MVHELRSPPGRPVVLLVEDEEGDATLAETAFAAATVAIELHRVDTGFKALCFLRKEGGYSDVPTPDLILLDLRLPTLDGKEILEVIRTDRDLSRLPVVVWTSSASSRDIESCYQAGCSGYLRKTPDFAELSAGIASLCSHWFPSAVPGAAPMGNVP